MDMTPNSSFASDTDSTISPSDSGAAKESHTTAIKLDKMAKHNLYLLESGNFSDAEIVCKGVTWRVHKLILRSRCLWFNKAFRDDAMGEDTGRIRLETGHPEQILQLLQFIYTGRYIPALSPMEQCTTVPALEGNVDLWCLADSLGLPELKIEIQKYLLARLSATLCFLHAFCLYTHDGSPALRKDTREQGDMTRLLEDFSRAVTRAYKDTAAPSRPLQRLLAIFACGLQEHLPADTMWDLMRRAPKFQQDVSVVLISLHFSGPTNHAHALAEQGTGCLSFRCAGCDKTCGGGDGDGDGEEANLTLDPFSRATRKWCDDCAFWSMNSILKAMMRGWPAEGPELG